MPTVMNGKKMSRKKHTYERFHSIILTIALMYHKIMLWKIAGRADLEREAA